jgi:hypothetical protein
MKNTSGHETSSPSPTPQDAEEEEGDTDLKAAVDASLKDLPEQSSPAAPPTQSRPSSAGFGNARTSFGSISISSQTSKRKMENGREVVKGSDTETDDSDSDLEDITALFRKRTSPITNNSRHSASKDQSTEKNSMSLRSRLSKSTREVPSVPKKVAKKTYAFSLDSLVKDTKKASTTGKRAAEAKNKLRAIESSSSPPRFDKTSLAAIVEKSDTADEGRGRRVLEALARTEAFETSAVWHFFGESLNPLGSSFPMLSGGNHRLCRILNCNTPK